MFWKLLKPSLKFSHAASTFSLLILFVNLSGLLSNGLSPTYDWAISDFRSMRSFLILNDVLLVVPILLLVFNYYCVENFLMFISCWFLAFYFSINALSVLIYDTQSFPLSCVRSKGSSCSPKLTIRVYWFICF